MAGRVVIPQDTKQERRVGGEEGGLSLGMSEEPRGILGKSLDWQGHV